MNGRLAFGFKPQSLKHGFQELRRSRFASDRLSVSLLAGAVVVNAVTFVTLLPVVKPALQAPVRFSSLSVGYTLGVWYYPFLVASFGLAVAVLNGLMAYQAFGRSRLASFFLLTGGAVVSVFCLVIAQALGAAR